MPQICHSLHNISINEKLRTVDYTAYVQCCCGTLQLYKQCNPLFSVSRTQKAICSKWKISKWDTESPGPQVIVEVSEVASNLSTTNNEVGPKVIVRTEEVLIVVAVLVLWVGAIALFFNRWGKIRMLEPYQPKFQQQHRSSCPLVELEPIPALKHPSFSRISMGNSLPSGRMGSISGPSGSNPCAVRAQPLYARGRQNSVFVGSQYVAQTPSRKYQSAMDIHSLILDEAPEPV